MSKNFILVIALILAFVLGIVSYAGFRNSRDQQLRQRDASVLLERVREVCKLVTVEGDLSELYNETMTRQVTLYLPLPTQFEFDKKATVQVEGKVLVGYDLEQLDLKMDESNRTLTISNLPEPEILAVDHQIKYRNLTESWFNEFTPADYTALNESAKEFLRAKAVESELIDKAREQGIGILESIRFLAEAAGVKVIVIEAGVPVEEVLE